MKDGYLWFISIFIIGPRVSHLILGYIKERREKKCLKTRKRLEIK